MNRYLLDTHTLIWFLNGDSQVSVRVRETLEEPTLSKFVSIASLWEIAIKINIGKLELLIDYSEVHQAITSIGFEFLDIRFEDTLLVSKRPLLHRDPFDRLLVAQAKNNGLTILTRDQHIPSYSVPTLW